VAALWCRRLSDDFSCRNSYEMARAAGQACRRRECTEFGYGPRRRSPALIRPLRSESATIHSVHRNQQRSASVPGLFLGCRASSRGYCSALLIACFSIVSCPTVAAPHQFRSPEFLSNFSRLSVGPGCFAGPPIVFFIVFRLLFTMARRTAVREPACLPTIAGAQGARLVLPLRMLTRRHSEYCGF